MRKRILIGCHSMDYIYKSRFKNAPRQLFLCIWPQKPNEPRASFVLKKASQDELILLSEQEPFHNRNELFCLQFDKKSNVLNGEHFPWSHVSKGYRSEVNTKEVKENKIIFSSKQNHNKKFKQMLDIINSQNSTEQIKLKDYMDIHLREKILQHNTYGFAIYIKVKFKSDKINFKGNKEEIYRFDRKTQMPIENLPVGSVLYIFEDIPKSKLSANTSSQKEQESEPEINATNLVGNKNTIVGTREIVKNFLKSFAAKLSSNKHFKEEDYDNLTINFIEELTKEFEQSK